MALRAELIALGYPELAGRWSPRYGLDVTEVHDPAEAARYVRKWPIGAELLDAGNKTGTQPDAMPIYAVPAVIAGDGAGTATPARSATPRCAAWWPRGINYSGMVRRGQPQVATRSRTMATDLVPEWAALKGRPWPEQVQRLLALVRDEFGADAQRAGWEEVAAEAGPFDGAPDGDDRPPADPPRPPEEGTLVVDQDTMRAARHAYQRGHDLDQIATLPNHRDDATTGSPAATDGGDHPSHSPSHGSSPMKDS